MAEKFPVTFDENKYPIGYIKTPIGTVVVHKAFLGTGFGVNDAVTAIREVHFGELPPDDLGHRVISVSSLKHYTEGERIEVAKIVGKTYIDPPYFM